MITINQWTRDVHSVLKSYLQLVNLVQFDSFNQIITINQWTRDVHSVLKSYLQLVNLVQFDSINQMIK